MGLVRALPGSATSTPAVRRAIRHSREGPGVLAKRYGINQRTVAKWNKRTAVTDRPTGPKDALTVLSIEEEEVIIVAIPRHMPPPLDDRPHARQTMIAHLSGARINPWT